MTVYKNVGKEDSHTAEASVHRQLTMTGRITLGQCGGYHLHSETSPHQPCVGLTVTSGDAGAVCWPDGEFWQCRRKHSCEILRLKMFNLSSVKPLASTPNL